MGVRPSGYRLPEATTLGGVVLQVADIDRSLRFYQDVLGLRLLSQDNGVATLGVMGRETPLVTLHGLAGASPVPLHGRLGVYHFAILLPSRAALGRCLAHLMPRNVRVGMADHLVSEALYLNDPDGLGIELYCDRPRETWRAHGEELAMASDPLDVDALLAAGAGDDWRGMPEGTVLGHVHLHIGDLRTGEAFFHQALGFDKMVWSYPGALFLAAGGYHHHLGTNIWAAGAPRPVAHDAQLLEWQIIVPTSADVAAVAESLSQHGHAVDVVPTAVRVVDPWGTPLRVQTPEHR